MGPTLSSFIFKCIILYGIVKLYTFFVYIHKESNLVVVIIIKRPCVAGAIVPAHVLLLFLQSGEASPDMQKDTVFAPTSFVPKSFYLKKCVNYDKI